MSFDINSNHLVQKAQKNGWRILYKFFAWEERLALKGVPTDKEFILDVENTARRDFGFIGTESSGFVAPSNGRVIVTIENPDSIGEV